MEKIFFIKNGDLEEVNKALTNGGRIKSVNTVAESVAHSSSFIVGCVYAYIVVEFDNQ